MSSTCWKRISDWRTLGTSKLPGGRLLGPAGKWEFFVPRAGDEAEGSLKKSGRYDAANTVKVSSVSLDQVVENGIKRSTLSEIDVGALKKAFRGAAKNLLSSKTKPVIMVRRRWTWACMNFGVNWLDVVEKVKSFGYRIHQADAANYFATPE